MHTAFSTVDTIFMSFIPISLTIETSTTTIPQQYESFIDDAVLSKHNIRQKLFKVILQTKRVVHTHKEDWNIND